jgi:hypothetical protein
MFKRVLYIVLVFIIAAGGCKKGSSGDSSDSNSGGGDGVPPKINFEQVYYDFGDIVQGEKVAYSFQFENKGGSPLVIEDAFASCGCTVPEYDREPISPGDKGRIEVIFDSSGRRGNQYKSVIIKTNTPEGEQRLTIKANVLTN